MERSAREALRARRREIKDLLTHLANKEAADRAAEAAATTWRGDLPLFVRLDLPTGVSSTQRHGLKRKAPGARGGNKARTTNEAEEVPSFGQQIKAAIKAFADKHHVEHTPKRKPRLPAAVKVGG